MIWINCLFVYILSPWWFFFSVSTSSHCCNRLGFFFFDHSVISVQTHPFFLYLLLMGLGIFFLFSPLLPVTSETRGSAEHHAANGHADWRGVRDEVPHRNGLCPQTAGCTQGKKSCGGGWRRATSQANCQFTANYGLSANFDDKVSVWVTHWEEHDKIMMSESLCHVKVSPGGFQSNSKNTEGCISGN